MEISIIKIKKVLDGLLGWVRSDLVANLATPEESWLYTEFNSNVVDGMNLYEQLYSIISMGQDDRRMLVTRLMFDKDRASLPTIHVNYPAEDGRSGDNTLNTGWMDMELIGTPEDENERVVYKYSRSFIGQYDLIITGANSLEVVMVYEFLDALLMAGADTLAYNFDKFDFSGKQLLTNPNIIPHLIFYRAIGLSVQAKKKVRAIMQHNTAHDIAFIPEYYLKD